MKELNDQELEQVVGGSFATGTGVGAAGDPVNLSILITGGKRN